MTADTASATVTQLGVVMGTVGEMSPEQAAGAVVDPRSDVFSFGIVLHEMLSGRRPFAAASTEQELQRIINGAPHPLPGSAAAAAAAHCANGARKTARAPAISRCGSSS